MTTPNGESTQVTELLHAWRGGDEQAREELLGRVYQALRKIASIQLRRERDGHTLQPTALVNEAYLRLFGERRLDWNDRAHFFAVAAITMRRILVDHARARHARKRQRDDAGEPLTLAVADGPDAELLDLDRALTEFAQQHPRAAKVVEMRYFAELELDEIAVALDVSPTTVKRDWTFARAWLRSALADGA
jgi:RNA polymerase sigma factor (TIGR02999 family)